MMHFVAFFITIAILVMFLGSKQQRGYDRYGLAAMALFALLALTGTLLLHGTIFFSAAAFATALLLCVHHIISHFNTNNAESERCTLFSKEPSWHETWIVAAIVAGVVSVLKL
jgi:ABC-type branched-subunit amino acid transport system permease subunit